MRDDLLALLKHYAPLLVVGALTPRVTKPGEPRGDRSHRRTSSRGGQCQVFVGDHRLKCRTSGLLRWCVRSPSAVSPRRPASPGADNSRVLAIGNLMIPGHISRRSVSAFDTPAYTGEEVPKELLPLLVSPEWVEERKVRWGVTSPIYQSKVLGEFPDISDDTLILPK
jgi:hypothetical protein